MPNDDYIKRSDANTALKEWCTNPANRRRSCFEVINDVPAADVAPVKHGRWKEYQAMVGYYLECSYCGVKFNTVRMLYTYRYCPSCGARMLPEKSKEEVV